MTFSDEVNEEAEMIKYCAKTERELAGLKTQKDFAGAVRKELETIDGLEKFLYDERNKAFELNRRINKKELKKWHFKDIEKEIDFCEKQAKTVKGANKSYRKLTGKGCSFYVQYKNLMGDVSIELTTEYMIRINDGDFR